MAEINNELGLDVVLEIIGHLDSYTMLAMLEAYPYLKRYTVIVKDHMSPPMFFHVEGVRRMILSTWLSRKLFPVNEEDFFNPLVDKYSIKLIECAYTRTLKDMVKMHQYVVPKWAQIPRLDHSSFVFVRTEFVDGHEHHFLAERLDQFTDSKWHFGVATSFAEKYIDEGVFQPKKDTCYAENYSLGPGPCLTGLATVYHLGSVQTLRLENIPEIRNLNLPQLKSLSIIYTTRFKKRPLIRYPSFPKLTKFVVHFKHHVPCFQRMENVATKGAHDLPRVFELADIGCLQNNVCIFPSQVKGVVNSEEYDEMDKSFIERFCSVHIYGVPFSLFATSNPRDHTFDETKLLRLNYHEIYCPDDGFYSMPNLKTLIIFVQAAGGNIPHIVADRTRSSVFDRHRSNIDSLKVYMMNTDIDINSVTKHYNLDFRILCLFSSSKILKWRTGRVYRMWHKHWQRLRICQHKPVSRHDWRFRYGILYNRTALSGDLLSLVGFVMPILKKRDDDNGGWSDFITVDASRVIMRPAMFHKRNNSKESRIDIERFVFGRLEHRMSRNDLTEWNNFNQNPESFLGAYIGGYLVKQQITLAPIFVCTNSHGTGGCLHNVGLNLGKSLLPDPLFTRQFMLLVHCDLSWVTYMGIPLPMDIDARKMLVNEDSLTPRVVGHKWGVRDVLLGFDTLREAFYASGLDLIHAPVIIVD